MRSFILKFVILFCVLSVNVTADTLNIKDLHKNDIEIAGIRIFQPMKEILNKFGKPLEIETFDNYKYNNKSYTYYFPDIEISFYSPTTDENNIVKSVTVKKKGYKTFRGVEVGDLKSKVIHLYGEDNGEPFGEGDVIYDEDNPLWYEYFLENAPDHTIGINFSFKDGKVIKFKIGVLDY